MAEILSMGDDPQVKIPRENPIKAIVEKFNSLDRFFKFSLASMLLLALVIPFTSGLIFDTRQRATGSTPTVTLPPEPDQKEKGKKLLSTVEARFYANVKDQLRSGDFVSMPAVRQSADTAMTADNWKLKQAVAALNSVDEKEIGIQKGIFLSAAADVENLINEIPSSVNWIFYNMEPGMTPSSDLQDPVNSVRRFATVVHNSGRKFGFAPGRNLFDQYQGRQELKDSLLLSDMVLYQGQLLLPTMSEEDFVKTVKEKYNYVKGVSPNTQFHLQLWLGRQTPDQMAKVFNRSDKYFDNAVIGTHSDLEGILQVLPQLKWRSDGGNECQPRPACLDATPRCLMPEPANGWCTVPTPTCIPRPACLDSNPPCLIAQPAQGWCPNITSVPTPTCTPRPSCLDTIPRCLMPEPANGWCTVPTATSTVVPL